MKETRNDKELEKEKEILNRLVLEAFDRGIPLTDDKAVMEQNLKVDDLIARMQKEKRKHKKDQQER